MRTATARAHAHGRTLAPRAPRRVSGPVARPRPRQPVAPPTLLARLRALPETRLLDRLLGGRVWIWVIGIGLMGIVAMQVSLLKLNTGISRAVQTATTLERSNAQLEKGIARAASSERIQRIALKRGMIAPSAGSVVYVSARPDVDAARAVKHMGAPSLEARALAAAPAAPETTTTTAASTATGTTSTTTSPAPVATPSGVAAAPTPGQG